GGKCVSKNTKNLGTGGCFVLSQFDDCGGTQTGLTCVPRYNTTCQAPDNKCVSFTDRSVNYCGTDTSTNTDICGSGLCSYINGQPIISGDSKIPPSGQSNPPPGQLCVNSGGTCVSSNTSLISCTQKLNVGYDDCVVGLSSFDSTSSIKFSYSTTNGNLVCVKPGSCTN